MTETTERDDPMPVICANCAYFLVQEIMGSEPYFCGHPRARNLITGNPLSCRSARNSSDLCGDQGRYFVAKAPSESVAISECRAQAGVGMDL
jgi:hypothetical protein